MRATRRLRLLILIILVFAFCTGSFAQVFDNGPQSQAGQPRFGTFSGGRVDSINVYNGNLNLDIPLFSLPGRESSLDVRVVYNSLKWELSDVLGNFDGTYSGGWRISDPIGEAPAYQIDYVDCVELDNQFKHRWLLLAMWKDGLGTKHLFQGTHEATVQDCDVSPALLEPTINNKVLIGAVGGYAELHTGSNRTLDAIKFLDGSVLKLQTVPRIVTPNNNRILRTAGALMDTVGRTITFVDTAGLNDTYKRTFTVKDANGTSQVYTLNYQDNTTVCNPVTLGNETRNGRLESIEFPGGQTYTFEYSGNLHGYLTKVTLPSGAFIEYTYPGNACAVQHQDYVTSRKVSKGANDIAPSIWQYSRVALPNDFREVTVTNPDLTTTVVHTFNPQGQEEETHWKKGSEEPQIVYQLWGGSMPWQVRTVRAGLEQTTTRQFDQWGMVNWQTETDWHPGVGGGTVLSEITQERNLEPVGANALAPLLLRLQKTELRGIDPVSQVFGLQGKTVYEYDEFPFDSSQIHSSAGGNQTANNPGYTGRGNLTTVRSFKDATTSIESHFKYDNLGNRVQTIDPLNRITDISYLDNFTVSPPGGVVTFAYPTKVTNVLGQFASTKYNWDTGLPVESTDVRGQTSALSYDALGRPLTATAPGGSEVVTTYNDAALTIHTDVKGEDGKWLRSETLFDPLYRPVKATQFGLSSSDHVYAETEYDINGRAYRVSSPHRENETPRWTTTTAYDGLSRPKTVKNPDDSLIQIVYAAGSGAQTVTTTDENGTDRRMTYNGIGQMVKVEELRAPAQPLVTTYKYYPSGALAKVVQGAQTRTFTVNWLGQALNEVHPESGTTVFEYYADGQLLSRTDGRGAAFKASYFYDEIGRLATIDYADGTPDVIYGYDAPGFIGLLTHVTAAGVTDSGFTYDVAGQLKTEHTTLAGVGSFDTAYDYDKAGRLTAIHYPSGRTVTRKYLSSGGTASNRLEDIQEDKTGATVLGNVTETTDSLSRTLGGTINETWSFNTRNQLAGIEATSGGTSLFNMSYGYGANNNGRIRSRTDNLQPEHSVSYSYDKMNRLEAASAINQSWNIGWALDDYGNRTTQSPTGLASVRVGSQQISIDAANNRHVGWGYDDAGNVTSDGAGLGGHLYAYDAESRLISIDTGQIRFYYDAGGRRIAKATDSETTFYLYGLSGLLSEFTTTNGGTGLPGATDRLEYRVAEQTGTPVLLLDGTGTPIEANRVFPFGEPWQQAAASTNDQTFTTYDRDAMSGLDYAMARMYGSREGRFMTPDPGHVGGNVGDPQSWNAYAYALNDPINLIDPSGLCPVDGRPECDITVTTPDPGPSAGYLDWLSRLLLDPSLLNPVPSLIGAVVDTVKDIRKPKQETPTPYDCSAGGQFICDCNGNRIGGANVPSASVPLMEDPVFFAAGFAASRIMFAGAMISGTTGSSKITTLYHGSDVASVRNIVANGISKTAASATGGGDVFWTTPSKDVAMCFARSNPAQGVPSIAGFTIQNSTLQSLTDSGAVVIDPIGAYIVKNWSVFNKAVTKRFIVE